MDENAPPETLPGHWNTSDGQDMAKRYAAMSRRELAGGHMSDMEAAFHIAMTMRGELAFEARLAVAKDRIRWLSAQLALALEAFRQIDALPVMELNLNNYTADDVAELNSNAVQAALIARSAVSRCDGDLK